MQKIRLWLHSKDARKVLKAVQRSAAVEFTKIDAERNLLKNELTDFELAHIAGQLDFAVRFLEKFENKKSGMKALLEGDKVRMRTEDCDRLLRTFDYKKIVRELGRLEGEINVLGSTKAILEEEERLLSGWKSLSIPPSVVETASMSLSHWQGSHADRVLFEGELKAAKIDCEIYEVDVFSYLLVVFKKDFEQAAKLAIVSHLEKADLGKSDKVPAVRLECIAEEMVEIARKIEKTKNEVKEYLPELTRLKVISDSVSWQKAKHEVASSASGTKTSMVLEGWCPASKLESLIKAIEKETELFFLTSVEPTEGEDPPVEIENNAVVLPFESITRLYGLPGHKDLDPTMFLSGFFFIFFGLCLTDVGYGLFLAGIIAAILFFFKIPKDSKKLLLLLMFGGISAAVAGVFFGGYLGVPISALPKPLANLQLFDPIQSPMPVLFLSLALGVLQVLFGIVLRIYREAKNGRFGDGILDGGPWLLLFGALFAFGASKLGFLSRGGDGLTTWFLLIAVALLVATQGRKEKTILGKFFKGTLSLYDSVGYFSDILSYSRILALGLATSALAFAVNLIAALLRDMIPVVGTAIMVLVLIIGHLFNLAVNTLGAFIHSARLQFVEFFGKFIAGSGRQFKPFKREEKYVTIEEM
ncbi:MAG: V-type ATPase 116kDa subunit family protein [bacterium]|nr:V-type ATPase 116kDa subunit family protein [bacterium]